MIKSINQLITRRCNSRCIMCNIWRAPYKREMVLEDFSSLYSHTEFSDVEDLCISGGEPTLRKDLSGIVKLIVSRLKHLRMIFLSTNGSNPRKVLDFIKAAKGVPEIYIVVSLEGDRDMNKKIRGVDSYDLALETLRGVANLKRESVKGMISTTLLPENCNKKQIGHLEELAKQIGCLFTFRFFDKSKVFYGNDNLEPSFSEQQRNFVLRMVKQREKDPFMRELFKHLKGETTIMGKKSRLKCLAGKITVFIDCDGTIRPCIYSQQIIGNSKLGIFEKSFVLKETPACPCCTECQVYPKLNYGNKDG